MVREKEIGLSITSHIADSSIGSELQSLKPQSPKPIEIVNVRSLGKKEPFKGTRSMRRIEEQHSDKPIEDILHELYWDQKKSPREIGRELDKSEPTIIKWLRLSGEEIRSISEAVKVHWDSSYKRRETKERKNSTTHRKFLEAKAAFGVESDEEFKLLLGKMYNEHKAIAKVARIIRGKEVKLSDYIARDLMSYAGIQLIDRTVARLEERSKLLVDEAYETRDIWRVTENQRDALRLRFREGKTLNECARKLGLGDRRVVWDRVARGLKNLNRMSLDLD